MKPHILVIGGGKMGRRHIRALLRTRRCEVSCIEPKPSALPLKNVYPSIEKTPRGAFDGAIVASPASSHVSYGLWCAKQGMPFLLEKPISLAEKDIAELIKKTKVVAGVAYPRRHAAAILQMKSMLAQGRLGRLKMIQTSFSQDFRKYRPDHRNTYYARISTGGGILLDALSHHIDLATFFAGPVAQVSSFHGKLVFGEDAALLNLRFANGVLGSVTGNQFQKPNVDLIELIGTKANARYERVSGVLSWNASDSTRWKTRKVDGDWDDIIQRQAEGFLDAIEEKKPLPTSLADAWHTLKVVLAARRSQATGRTAAIR